MSCASSPLAQAFLDSLSQRAPATENSPHLTLTFLPPSHVFRELKGNIISNLIYSYCTAHSITTLTLQGRGAHPLCSLPTSLAPLHHWASPAGTDTLPLPEIHHIIFFPQHHLSSVQQKAADTLGGCPRWWHVQWLLWTPVPAMSTEHNSHTMPASSQRMLFLPHLWPRLRALRSGSLQRGDLSGLRTQQPLKEQSWHDLEGHQSCPGHRSWGDFLFLFLGAGREKSNTLRTRAPQEYRVSGQALPRQFSCYSACPTFWPQKWYINSTVMRCASYCGYCGFASYYNFNL